MVDKKAPELRFKGFTEDWEQRKLKDLMSFSNGINAPKENYGKGRNMISVLDVLSPYRIEYSRIRSSVQVDKTTEDKNKVELGDLLFVRSSEIVEEVGWAKAYLDNDYALYSGFTIRGKKKTKFEPYFVELSLNYSNRKQIERKAGGSTRYNVSQTILNAICILSPDMEEQTKIGTFFERIDETITLHQRKLEVMKQLKQAYLQQLFPEQDSKVPNLRFTNFRQDWEQRKLFDIGKISTGNTPPTKDSENYSDDGMLWVTPTDINSLVIKDTTKRLSKKGQQNASKVNSGSILVTCIASIGKNTMVSESSSFNQQINALTPFSTYDSYFLLTQSFCWSRKMKSIASSGTMQIVNKTEFSNLVFMFPKLSEQKKIGSFFNIIDNTIDLHQQKLTKLEKLKSAYLQKMFI